MCWAVCSKQYKAFGLLCWKRPLQIGLPLGTPATATNAGVHKSRATLFCTVAPQIFYLFIYLFIYYGTCFRLPTWPLEFWGGSWIFAKYVHPCTKDFRLFTFPPGKCQDSISHLFLPNPSQVIIYHPIIEYTIPNTETVVNYGLPPVVNNYNKWLICIMRFP